MNEAPALAQLGAIGVPLLLSIAAAREEQAIEESGRTRLKCEELL
jgi:hypothetical protein